MQGHLFCVYVNNVCNVGKIAFFSAFFVFFAIFLVSSIILYIFAPHLVLHRRMFMLHFVLINTVRIN